MLAGEAGIGKTRLADELASHARAAGATVVWGRCWEGGGAPAYWPWMQVLRELTEGLDTERIDRLAGVGAPALRELLTGLPTPGDGDGLDGEDRAAAERLRFYLFDGVTSFLSGLSAQRPLVLILDDLHEADRPSLLLLRFLARERRNGRLLVIGTYRDVEAHRLRGVGELMTALTREGHVLRLRGLPVEQVRAFMRQATGASPPERIVRLVHRTTEGNPFFLDGVVRLLDDKLWSGRGANGPSALRIPDEVRETIRRRVAPLPAEVLEVLAVAATIGREFDVGLLHPVCEMSTQRLLELLGEATAQGVLQETPERPGRFTFAHTLIRDTLYEDVPPARRVQLHRRVGEALERLHDPEALLPQLAHHFYQAVPAGDPKVAITYALRAGRQALVSLAYEDALMHFERATEVASTVAIGDALRCKLLLSMGDAQAKVGDPAAARLTFERAAAVARSLGDAERLALAALGAGGPQPPSGVTDPQLDALLNEALEALGRDDSSLRGRLLARKAMGGYYTTPRGQRVAMTAEAVDIATRLEDRGLLAYALDARCYALWTPDDVDARLDAATQLMRLAREVGDAELALEGHLWRIISMLERADIAGADAEIEAYARIASELHQPTSAWQTEVLRAMRALLDGRVAQAETLTAKALQLAQRDPLSGAPEEGTATRLGPNAALAYATQMFNVRTHQGRVRELEETVRELMNAYPALPVWRCSLAYLLCTPAVNGSDETREVRALFDNLAAKDFEDIPRDGNWLVAMVQLSEVAAHLGDANRARVLHTMLSPHAGRQVVAGRALACRGAVSHYLGLLSSTMGKHADADQEFEAALDLHQRLRAPIYAARTRWEWGRALVARGGSENVSSGSLLLEQAVADFAALGLEHLAASDRELFSGLERPRAPARPSRPAARQAPTASLAHEGDIWTITFDGRTTRLRDMKGLHYLAELLTRPDREIHAMDLAGGGTGDLGDGGPVLDPKARRAYQDRIAELQEDIDEARSNGDLERAAQAEAELDFFVRELSAAVGLAGRDRSVASPAERARVNVTRAIHTAVKRIEGFDRGLARHLKATVRTGTFCMYAPDPRAPVDWRIERR